MGFAQNVTISEKNVSLDSDNEPDQENKQGTI